jgi:hypothetical protein
MNGTDWFSDPNFIKGLTDAERSRLVWPMTAGLALEAAMVLWEAMNDLLAKAPGPVSEPPSGPDGENNETTKVLTFVAALDAYRSLVGTVQLRHDTMALIEPLHVAWSLAEGREGLPISFDWEFTPAFLVECVEIDSFGLTLRSDWQEIVRSLPSRMGWLPPAEPAGGGTGKEPLPVTATTVSLDNRQLAAVLAGLRLVQAELPRGEYLPQGVHEIFDDGGSIEPLSVEEIDTLAETLNCA